MDRREFLKKSSLMGSGVILTAGCGVETKRLSTTPVAKKVKPVETVKIGFVGVGGMGSWHCKNLLNIEGAEIRAVCDIVESKVEKIQKWCVDAGFKKPAGYTKGEFDFKRMIDNEDLDLVINATPWRWHVPISVYAMKNGKHAASEVPAALTVDDNWKLVETSEITGKYCVMLENCNYDKAELTILNMVRKGMFGELIHGACGYLHDLRGIKFSNKGEGLWRLDHSVKRNGNLYPTHGLGPVAQYMDINRGNRFEYLVSMSSKSRGLNAFASDKFGKDSPEANRKYALGDVNVSLIKTSNGETITVYHDTNLPRPYSRINEIQGTKGIFMDYPPRIYIEGISKKHDQWEPLKRYFPQYIHPLWRDMEESTKGAAGHGGMDYLEDFRLIDALRKGRVPDMDVYDAAALSVVVELSEISVANGGKPVKFPDFTRGKWETNERIFLTDYKY